VFKIIEGAAYSLALFPDPELEKTVDGIIAQIAAAQEDDGYLYTARTAMQPDKMPPGGEERWSDIAHGHELYNVGHLYEGAVAYYQATGKRTLLDVALKNAELILDVFGPDQKRYPPGHQEIEIGLVKLYRRRLLFPAFLCRDYGFEAFLKAFLEIFQINVIAHGILSLSWFFLEDGERTIRHGDLHHH